MSPTTHKREEHEKRTPQPKSKLRSGGFSFNAGIIETVFFIRVKKGLSRASLCRMSNKHSCAQRMPSRTHISTICRSYDTGYGAFSASNEWCLCPCFIRNCVSFARASRLPAPLVVIVVTLLGRGGATRVVAMLGRGVEMRVTVDCVAKLWRGVASESIIGLEAQRQTKC